MARRKSTTQMMSQNSSRQGAGRRRRRRSTSMVGAVTGAMSGLSVSRPVRAPAAASLVVGRPNPVIRSLRSSTLICNVEAVATISVASAASVTNYPLIPSLVGSWITGVASNWSKWKWIRLRFVYVPTCPTSSVGSVHMGLQYDFEDALPANVADISALGGYTTGPVWSGYQVSPAMNQIAQPLPGGSIAVTVDVGRLEKRFYSYVKGSTFTTIVGTNFAYGITYAPGRLVVLSADGTATATNVGRLYVQYEIELLEPIASSLNG